MYSWDWSAKVVKAFWADHARVRIYVQDLFSNPFTDHQLTYYLSCNSPVWSGFKRLIRGCEDVLEEAFGHPDRWPPKLSLELVNFIYQRSISDIERALDKTNQRDRLKKLVLVRETRHGGGSSVQEARGGTMSLPGQLEWDF